MNLNGNFRLYKLFKMGGRATISYKSGKRKNKGSKEFKWEFQIMLLNNDNSSLNYFHTAPTGNLYMYREGPKTETRLKMWGEGKELIRVQNQLLRTRGADVLSLDLVADGKKAASELALDVHGGDLAFAVRAHAGRLLPPQLLLLRIPHEHQRRHPSRFL